MTEGPKNLRAAWRLFFTFPSPMVVTFLLVTAVVARLALGSWSWTDAVITAALLAAWPFIEWLIHVHVLHFRPRQIGPLRLDPIVTRKHRVHHAHPWDVSNAFIPVHTYLYYVPGLTFFWYAVTPDLPSALTGWCMTNLLTFHYEWVHYLVHTRYTPKSRLYRRLWRNHRLHHCKNERYWQGVTMLLADRVLRTGPDPDEVETSKGAVA